MYLIQEPEQTFSDDIHQKHIYSSITIWFTIDYWNNESSFFLSLLDFISNRIYFHCMLYLNVAVLLEIRSGHKILSFYIKLKFDLNGKLKSKKAPEIFGWKTCSQPKKSQMSFSYLFHILYSSNVIMGGNFFSLLLLFFFRFWTSA